jgi:hypothetical protein
MTSKRKPPRRAAPKPTRPRPTRPTRLTRSPRPTRRPTRPTRPTRRPTRPTRPTRTPTVRWNPEPEEMQRSVVRLVLTIVEFLRRLMERQAVRRMEERTLTRKEIAAVGLALMRLEETIDDIGAQFGLRPEDLNLDLAQLGKLM